MRGQPQSSAQIQRAVTNKHGELTLRRNLRELEFCSYCRSLRSRHHNRTKQSERLEVTRMWKMYFFERGREKLEISAAARHTRSFGGEEKKRIIVVCFVSALDCVRGVRHDSKAMSTAFFNLSKLLQHRIYCFSSFNVFALVRQVVFFIFFHTISLFLLLPTVKFHCCSMHDPSSFSAKLEKHLNEQVHFLKEVQSSMKLQNQPSYPSPSSLARPSATKVAASTAAAAYNSLQSSKNGQRPQTRARPEAVTVVNKLTNHKKTSAAATMMNTTTINKGGKKVCAMSLD